MAKHKPHRIVVYGLARVLAGAFYILPRKTLQHVAKIFGRLVFYFVPKHREATIKHLTIAFEKEKSEKEIRKIARKVFENLAQTAAEVLQFTKLTPEKMEVIVDTGDSYEIYKKLLDEGKGLITVTSHIGNWELLGAIPALKGFKSRAIARKARYHRFHRWIENLRNSVGIELFYNDESPRKLISWLKKDNGALGILPDQDRDSSKGVFVDFFGKPAYTSIAPVKLSLMTGAPIATVFLVRIPKNRYKIIFRNVVRPKLEEGQTEEEAILKYTRDWMKSCENVIRQYPEQWGWMHNRWKTVQASSSGEGLVTGG